MTKPTIQKNQAGWFDVIYKGDTFPCPNWAEAKKVENVIFRIPQATGGKRRYCRSKSCTATFGSKSI